MNPLRRIAALFRRSRLDREMAEEMAAHLERETEQNLTRGLPPDEARFAARRAFGGLDQLKERERDARGMRWLDDAIRDVRHGLRRLAKSPLFTTVTLLSLALGIGINTAVFSLINAVLLRPLPVANPHELRVVDWSGHDVRLDHLRGTPGGINGVFPYPIFADFRRRASGRATVFAFASLPNLDVRGPDGASTADGLLVSGDFFAGYGAAPLIGRTITPRDDRAAAPAVAVITHRWWENHFGADPHVLGRSISLNRHSFTIIGVLPSTYAGPTFGDTPDIYVPMSAQPRLFPGFPLASKHHWWVQVMARLDPGTNAARLQAAFDVGFRRALEAPGQPPAMKNPGIVLVDGSSGPAGVRHFIALPLLGLLAIVTVLLLVACANLAGLLMARGVAQGHEMAVRAALGASRGRLIRQSLTETLLLAVGGGGLGLLLASWGRAALILRFLPIDASFHLHLRTDSRVLLFTLVVSLLTAVTAGLLPALRGSRAGPGRDLASTPQAGGSRQRTGRTLVAMQMGLSALLVVAAGLFGRSLLNLANADPGFSTTDLLVFRLDSAKAGIAPKQWIAFFERARERLAALPGVRAVTLSDHPLLDRSRAANDISLPGHEPAPGVRPRADQLVVGDGFFSTMGIPLRSGRTFTARDDDAGPRVVIVNETFVRTFLAGVHPLGRTFTIGKQPVEIVGVCRDAAYTDIRSPIRPTMYLPCRQHSRGAMCFEVRSILPPQSIVPAVRRAMTAIAPLIPLTDLTTENALFRQSISLDRLASSLCLLLALLAVGLTCIGLYGLMAYRVACRTREIGVRIALGATPGAIAFGFLREALGTATWGLAAGMPLAFVLAVLARAVFYGVPPDDPLTFAGAAVGLLTVATLAACLPARRAARVDPIVALRTE